MSGIFYSREAYLTIPALAMNRPRKVNRITGIVTLALVLAAALPTLLPAQFPFLNPLVVDTDPENMLSVDQADRVFHNKVEDRFTYWDAIVVGIVNDSHPNGIYNVESLTALHSLSQSILELDGVIAPDLASLTRVDNIEQEGAGTIRF